MCESISDKVLKSIKNRNVRLMADGNGVDLSWHGKFDACPAQC